ncbi:MAG: TRAP transporter TatT component family protein [Gammaproteobacteria bacterium]|nr:TRAP transporter TatT component family protein [Gammaproteobacteria bacterium]
MTAVVTAKVRLCFAPTLVAGALLLLAGCAALGGAAAGQFADGLTLAILESDDPDLVREGTPAYLLLLDALVNSDPDNPRYLGAAAQLYAAYGIAFVADEERARTLTSRARDYGARAVCAADRDSCGLDSLDYDGFSRAVDSLGARDAEALYSYAVASLAYIRAHSSDWTAVAALPKIEYALQHLLIFEDQPRLVNVNMYLGVLNTLRPEALGGQPQQGQAYFEKADELSGGRNLAVKVEYARGYARLVYDRELHDKLLNEVLSLPTKGPGLTLFNTLAKRQARDLLDSADDYF